MRYKGKGAAVLLAAVMAVFAFSVPAFADAIAPTPLQMLMYRIEEYLPVILIVIGVLAVATAVILIAVFRARKKKQEGKS